MTVLSAIYVLGYSKRQVGEKLEVSRHTVGRLIDRGHQLIRVGLDLT